MRNSSSSWESCWSYPENCSLILPMVFLKSRGLMFLYCPAHRDCMITANSSATSPLWPRMLDLSEKEDGDWEVRSDLTGSPLHRPETRPVDVLQVVVVVEVLWHPGSVAKTLQDGVHVARVAQVTKAGQRSTQTSKRGIQVTDFSGRRSNDLRLRINF